MRKQHYFSFAVAVLSLVLLNLPFDAQSQRVRGSRNVESEMRQVPFFDAVQVGGSIDLYVTQGEEFRIEVVADDNLLQYIETNVNNGVLEVATKSGLSIRGYEEMKVYVTAPRFTSLRAAGSCDVYSTVAIVQDDLKLKASGSSDLKIEMAVRFLEIECNGSSDAILSGKAETVTASFSGSSDLKASNLDTQFLDLQLSGSSDATIQVQQEVTGSLKGSSDLRVIGNPVVKVSTSGSSSVNTGS